MQAARQRLPGLQVTVQGEMLTPQMEADLEEGRLDVAVLRPPVNSTAISHILLEQDELVAALPADSPPLLRRRQSTSPISHPRASSPIQSIRL